MKKRISFTTQGQRADIGNGIICRVLPNRYTETIGPFVFFDHLLMLEHVQGNALKKINENRAHKLTGTATLTYFMNEEYEDNKGYQANVNWRTEKMNAGREIIYAEVINDGSPKTDCLTNALQFCVNLLPKQRITSCMYLPIEASEIPKHMLSDNRGWLKLVVGEYENLACKVQAYTKQFLYHFHLEPGKQISTRTEDGLEYAIFLPLHDAVINGIEFNKGDVIEFDKQEGTIEISNDASVAADVIVFGGEKCV